MYKIFAACAVVLVTTSAYADEAGDISKLLRNGQADAAAVKLESALAAKPKDPQLRFLRGVIQIEQKKTLEAIATFHRMTEDFPELPEPYNNLAVLYASLGQYEKAKSSLELAIRTHPSYAVAHENLGDVYAKLASESYNKALQLDASNATSQIKLNVIKDLIGGKTVKPTPIETVAAKPVIVSTVASTAPAVTSPASVATTTNTPAPQTTKAASTSPAAAPVPVATVAAESSQDAVLQAVQAWANAWSKKDLDAYFLAYDKTFKPGESMSRKEWEAERRKRIEAKKSIKVGIEKPVVKLDGNKASVQFRQAYQADSLKVSSSKTLALIKSDGAWRIVSERTGR